MHFLGGLETSSGFCSNTGSGVENRNLKRGTKREVVTRKLIKDQNVRRCTYILYFLNFIHLNVNGTCLLQVAEQHVKNDNHTKRAFLTVLRVNTQIDK